MAKLSAALLLLLAIQQTAAYRLTPSTEAEEKDPQQSQGALAQISQDSNVYWCSSFCIPCESGKRAVLVSRSRSMWSHIGEWTATAAVITVGAVVTPWVFLGIPALMAAKVYFDELPIQCPNLDLFYFDKNEDGGEPEMKKFDKERLTTMLAKDEYLQLFRKDLNRVYASEQAAKQERDATAVENLFAFANRSHGQLPDSLLAYASSAELFCGDQDGNLGEVMEEHLGWGKALMRECKQVVSPPTRCCCKKEELAAGDELTVLVDSPDGNYKIGDKGTIDRLGQIENGEKRFQITWENPTGRNWTTHALKDWHDSFKKNGQDGIECKLMQEDELKKSNNPFKWGQEVCPASLGYHRYTWYGIDEPEVCKQ